MQLIIAFVSAILIAVSSQLQADETEKPTASKLNASAATPAPPEKEKAFQQLNHLFNLCYKTHERLILEQQSTIPFGAFADISGKVNYIHLNDVGNASKPQIINAIKSALIKLAKQQQIFAAAIFQTKTNFETKEGVYPFALVAQLEHANGLSLAIASKFSKENETHLTYAPPLTSEIPSEIFFWAYKESQPVSSEKDPQLKEPNQS